MRFYVQSGPLPNSTAIRLPTQRLRCRIPLSDELVESDQFTDLTEFSMVRGGGLEREK